MRAVLRFVPDISFTVTPSEQPILRIFTTLEFQCSPPDNLPFMTLSPLALVQLKEKQIDPSTFQPSNGSRRIRNIFLLGTTLAICLVPQRQEQRLHHLIAEMGGWVRSDSRQKVGHLVRRMGHHHESDLLPTNSGGGEVATMLIRSLEINHVGTIVELTGIAAEVRPDRENPALLWVEMHDLPSDEPSRPHHRKPGSVGMMILAEERGLIPPIPFTFQAEVHAASGRFMPDAPTKMTRRHMLHLYLRLIAVQEELGPEHRAELSERDDGIDSMEGGQNPEIEKGPLTEEGGA